MEKDEKKAKAGEKEKGKSRKRSHDVLDEKADDSGDDMMDQTYPSPSSYFSILSIFTVFIITIISFLDFTWRPALRSTMLLTSPSPRNPVKILWCF